MPTRSSVLVATQVTQTGSVVIYDCPTGFYVIVKSVYTLRASGNTTGITINVNRPGVAAAVIYSDTTLRAAPSSTSPIWVVLETSDQLVAAISEGAVYVWISGALLPAPPA